MEELRFAYMVNPRRPIRGIQDLPAIKTSRILQLAKEEVLTCMKCGPVYRHFGTEGNQRVTGENIDRLHNEKFYSEAEWKAMQNGEEITTNVEPEGVGNPNVAPSEPEKPVNPEPVEPEKVDDEPKTAEDTVKVEEPVETAPVEETPVEVSNESAQNVEEVAEANIDVEPSTSVEDANDSDSVADEINSDSEEEVDGDSEEDQNVSINPSTVVYSGNGKKKNKHRN